MNRVQKKLAAIGTAVLLAAPMVAMSSSAAAAAGPHAFKNCTALNKTFHHGVGRPGARDKTSGTRVTNFTRSKAWYNKNTKSDRDKDGIACEKH